MTRDPERDPTSLVNDAVAAPTEGPEPGSGGAEAATFRANRKLTTGAVVAAVLMNAAFWGVAAYVLHEGFAEPPVQEATLLFLILPLAGVIMAWKTVLTPLRRQRAYGETSFQLDGPPPAPGGWLLGRIHAGTEGQPEPADGFRVCLSCYKRVETWRRRRRGRSRKEVRYHLIWRDEKRVRASSGPRTSSMELPVAFRIPEDAPPSDHDRSGGRRLFRARRSQVVWRLEVLGAMPGLDFTEAIGIPVGSGPAPDDPRLEEQARQAKEYEVGIDRPRSEGIGVRSRPSGGLEVTFSSRRHRARAWMALAVGVLAIGTGAFLLGPTGQELPGFVPIFLIIFGLLGLFGAYDYARRSGRVVVDDREVKVRHRRRTTSIPLDEVEEVRAELERPSRRGGRRLPPGAIPALYTLKIFRDPESTEIGQKGKRFGAMVGNLSDQLGGGDAGDQLEKHMTELFSHVTVAEHLDDKPEAEWLARSILDTIHGLRPETDSPQAHGPPYPTESSS